MKISALNKLRKGQPVRGRLYPRRSDAARIGL
jgi:hypothetical protein